MIDIFLYILFTSMAGIFWAVCDLVENENFYNSVFRNLNEHFWYKRISWKYAKRVFKYPIDAWHISKSIAIICFVLSASFAPPLPWWLILLVGGVAYNLSFNLFYNKILRKE